MFDAYKIGVTLSLTNHVSAGLKMMAGDFARTEAQANALKKQISSIQKAALKGGAMLGIGAGMLALFKAPLDEAKKFDQALGKFKLFGMGDAANAEAVKFARSMNVMGTSYTDNMKLMTEAQGVFRESGLSGPAALEGSKLAAPMLAKIQFASESLDDESKAKMHAQSLAMLRFVEQRGGTKDAATFNAISDAGWKAIQSSGGNVNFEQLRQFMARGGVAAQGLSDTALYAKLEPIIGELKGSTAGNAWMTSYNRLVGGVKVPNQVAHLLADSGIWDKNKIEWNSMGGIKTFKGNPLKDMETLSSDPVAFYEKNILPMYAKMNGGKGLSVQERGRENTMIFGRTGGAMFSLIDRQLSTINKSTSAWEKALTVDASVKAAGATMAGKEIDLHAKWAKVMNDLGNTILPYAISGVEKLTTGLSALAGWMQRNEGMTKLLVGAFTALAGALMIRGTLLLVTAAFRGLGLALAFQAAGGAAGIIGITKNLGAMAMSIPGVGAALTACLSPIGLVVIALGSLALAAYAFRPLADKEILNARTDGGANLTPSARARAAALGWKDSTSHAGLADLQAGSKADRQAKAAEKAESSKFYAGFDQNFSWAHFWGMDGKGSDASSSVAASNIPKRGVTGASASGGSNAMQSPSGLSDMIANAVKAALNGTSVKMDGTTVGNLVIDQMGRASMGPSTGTSGFDTRLGPLRPDYGF